MTLLGGLLLWLVGPPANAIGASGLIFGLIAFMIVAGILERRIVPLLVTLVVGFLYGGSLLWGILPHGDPQVSWQGHLSGAIAGVAVAYAWHERRQRRRAGGRVKPSGLCRFASEGRRIRRPAFSGRGRMNEHFAVGVEDRPGLSPPRDNRPMFNDTRYRSSTARRRSTYFVNAGRGKNHRLPSR